MKILQKKLRNSYFILSIILLLGLWYRMQGFLYGTFAFTYDVGRDMLALQQIVLTHKIPLIGATTGLPGIFYGPTWYYLLMPFFLITGGNPRGLALVMVASGVLTVFTGYFVGKNVGGEKLGLILATLLSVSEILNQISAQIWNPNLIPLFLIVTFYVILVKFQNQKKQFSWFFLAGLFLGVIFDLEIVFGILFVLSTFLYILITRKLRTQWKGILIFVFGLIVVQLPRMLFEMRHGFLMTKTFFSTLTSHTNSSLLSPFPNFTKVSGVFFTLWTDTIASKLAALGVIVLLLVLVIFAGSYKKLSEKEGNILRYSLSIIVVFFIGLSFFNHDIESHYYIGLPTVFIIILALSIYFAGKFLKISQMIILVCVAFFSISVNQLKLLDTFHKSTWIGDASVYRNQVEVINYIYKDTDGEKFNYATYTPPIYDYPYQYLFSYEGKNKYGYLPDNNHERLFYLIIEPDTQFPDRQKTWLDIRKGDGKVVSEKLFKSGIRVEKRLH